MHLKSLLHQTDMIFHRFNGIVTEHGDYISVETPSNPGYFWGNYLIFNHPPRMGDISIWRKCFHERFSFNPLIRHEVYAWDLNSDTDMPHTEAFINAGFHTDLSVTLSTQKALKPCRWNDQLVVRPLVSDDDWEAALNNQIAVNGKEFGVDEYRAFRTKKNHQYRKMVAEGLGNWWGGFLGGKLVADLGLFKDGTLGRFQLVSTLPEYRRRGICSTLLFKVAQASFDIDGLKTLVIAADEHYFARNIYQSVGFEIQERTMALELRPFLTVGAAKY